MSEVRNPYGIDLGDRNARESLHKTPEAIATIVRSLGAGGLSKRTAPGKWTLAEILVHLAQTELALTTRARFALSQADYVSQAFSQDDWMAIDNAAGARVALDTYTTLRQFNLAMWRALTPEQVDRSFTHPEYGDLTVGWIMAQMAGHDIHHLKQFQAGPAR